MKYGELTLGQVEALVNKLGGLQTVGGILSGELVVEPKQMKEIVSGSLKLVADGIMVSAGTFTRDSFFKNSPVKRRFEGSLRNTVFAGIPHTIPALQMTLRKHKLMKELHDSEILFELGSPRPFTPAEFAVIVKDLASRQPQGEAGALLTNGCVNIFYVKLEDGSVVAEDVFWDGGSGDWLLSDRRLDGDGWDDGDCVFSRG